MRAMPFMSRQFEPTRRTEHLGTGRLSHLLEAHVMGRTVILRLTLATALVTPLAGAPAHAGSYCAGPNAMLDVGGFSVPTTTAGAYPTVGVSPGSAAKKSSQWFLGVLNDVAVVTNTAVSLYVWDAKTGCKAGSKPLCSSAGTQTSLARCTFTTDSQRYLVEVRNGSTVTVDFVVVSVHHCFAKRSDGTCLS